MLVQRKKSPVWRDELAQASSQLSSARAQQRFLGLSGHVGVQPIKEHELQIKELCTLLNKNIRNAAASDSHFRNYNYVLHD